jgi:hypothetical protein
MSGTTKLTTTTVDIRLDCHSVPHLRTYRVLLDTCSYRDDLARELVSWHDRIVCKGRFSIHDMQVGSTNAAGSYPYHQFVRLWGWVRDVADSKFPRGVNDDCTHISLS